MTDETIKRDTVEYNDPTPFDNSKLQSISEISKAIRHKENGKDVREPIAQQGEALVKLIQDTGGNQTAEVIAARGNHELLQIREDAQDNAIIEAQSTANSKFDSNKAESYLKSITALPETFANLAEINNKYPSGKNGLMIAADNGHKYIWANSTWTDAGVYQSIGVAENGLDLTKINFDAAKLIGWDENAIDISPTGIQKIGTPITITFNYGCIWTLSGNMMTYLTSENVKKTIPDGYVLYLDVTKLDHINHLTADNYIIAKFSDLPQRWSNILLACNFSGRLLSPVQALQTKLSRNYYGLKDLTVPVSKILFFAPDNQDPIKIEDHTGNGATITFNKNTAIYSNNFSRGASFDSDIAFDLDDGQSLILSWLDAPDGDHDDKHLTAGDFTIEKATNMTSDYKHHLLLSYLGRKLVSHNVSLQIIIDSYYRKRMIKNDHNNVITVGQGHEYVTIQAAVDAAADSKDNPITILIMPGI
ncbi:MAG: hypothetical protein L0H99_03905, partial [Loigolactobacillus coryniformis]|nr:hypothetical protein [Loigolactobacillus coryniformis]